MNCRASSQPCLVSAHFVLLYSTQCEIPLYKHKWWAWTCWIFIRVGRTVMISKAALIVRQQQMNRFFPVRKNTTTHCSKPNICCGSIAFWSFKATVGREITASSSSLWCSSAARALLRKNPLFFGFSLTMCNFSAAVICNVQLFHFSLILFTFYEKNGIATH